MAGLEDAAEMDDDPETWSRWEEETPYRLDYSFRRHTRIY